MDSQGNALLKTSLSLAEFRFAGKRNSPPGSAGGNATRHSILGHSGVKSGQTERTGRCRWPPPSRQTDECSDKSLLYTDGDIRSERRVAQQRGIRATSIISPNPDPCIRRRDTWPQPGWDPSFRCRRRRSPSRRDRNALHAAALATAFQGDLLVAMSRHRAPVARWSSRSRPRRRSPRKGRRAPASPYRRRPGETLRNGTASESPAGRRA